MPACLEVLELPDLGESGAKVDARERWQKWTPLMVAASKDRCSEAEVLMAHGADLAVSVKGLTAADHAVSKEMLSLLHVDAVSADAGVSGAGGAASTSVERLVPEAASLQPQASLCWSAGCLPRPALCQEAIRNSVLPGKVTFFMQAFKKLFLH